MFRIKLDESNGNEKIKDGIEWIQLGMESFCVGVESSTICRPEYEKNLFDIC